MGLGMGVGCQTAAEPELGWVRLCGWLSRVYGVVLLIPFCGHVICSLAVAGLAFRYFVMSLTLRLGHPLRKPHFVDLRRVDILGLPRDWCVNLMAFARLHREWAKVATST